MRFSLKVFSFPLNYVSCGIQIHVSNDQEYDDLSGKTDWWEM
jgi:hypothetical protein